MMSRLTIKALLLVAIAVNAMPAVGFAQSQQQWQNQMQQQMLRPSQQQQFQNEMQDLHARPDPLTEFQDRLRDRHQQQPGQSGMVIAGGQILSIETVIMDNRAHLVARAVTPDDRLILLELGSPHHFRAQQVPLLPGSLFEARGRPIVYNGYPFFVVHELYLEGASFLPETPEPLGHPMPPPNIENMQHPADLERVACLKTMCQPL
ncbi:MAG: hypothetical protein WD294_00325 [Phycisphaeraceae bacterium]